MTVKGWDSETRQDKAHLGTLHQQGYQVAGFYLGGPNAATTHLGGGYAKALHLAGFVLVPIYVGYQAAQLSGLSPSKVEARVQASIKEALSLLQALHKEAPHAVIAHLSIDWEGPMTPEGAAYCRGVLDGIKGAQYLYRTDAGVATPDRHVWLAKPGVNSTQATALLGVQPYGKVAGVQYEWAPGLDISVWDDSVIPKGEPKPPKKSLRAYLLDALKAWRASRG